MHTYIPEQHEVVSDFEIEDFTVRGAFSALNRVLAGGSFQELIADELNRVRPFLNVWESQILALDSTAPVASTIGIAEAFLRTPRLSGVAYLSNNIVVSEALFDASCDRQKFLDSRSVCEAVRKQLPWTSDLTFSFPRIYEFFGYRNGWGFIRFPRKDDDGRDAGVLVSCTTIDPKVLRLLKATGHEHIVKMYNRVWAHSVHDYLHHVVLYTSPSFGIGRLSPMSVAGVNDRIDEWGRNMGQQKHNYEYWAHRTHRQITRFLLSEQDIERVLANAFSYVEAVYAFHGTLSCRSDVTRSAREDIVCYLIGIYLWPLNIILDPQSNSLDGVHSLIGSGPFSFRGSAIETVQEILSGGTISESPERLADFRKRLQGGLDGIHHFMNEAASPIESSIAGLLSEIGAGSWSEGTSSMTWCDRLRLTVCVTGYRGLYEGWRHNLPIIYRHQKVLPHEATIAFLGLLQPTLDAFEAAHPEVYELHGIVP